MLRYLENTGYPTLPFALVFHLARITQERAGLGKNKRMVGIHAHHDKSIRSQRVEIERDEQLPIIEAQVAKMIGDGPLDTLTLTFSTEGDSVNDIGIILEKGKEPMLFSWIWSPFFGIELITDKETGKNMDDWSGVRLAKNLLLK